MTVRKRLLNFEKEDDTATTPLVNKNKDDHEFMGGEDESINIDQVVKRPTLILPDTSPQLLQIQSSPVIQPTTLNTLTAGPQHLQVSGLSDLGRKDSSNMDESMISDQFSVINRNLNLPEKEEEHHEEEYGSSDESQFLFNQKTFNIVRVAKGNAQILEEDDWVVEKRKENQERRDLLKA